MWRDEAYLLDMLIAAREKRWNSAKTSPGRNFSKALFTSAPSPKRWRILARQREKCPMR